MRQTREIRHAVDETQTAPGAESVVDNRAVAGIAPNRVKRQLVTMRIECFEKHGGVDSQSSDIAEVASPTPLVGQLGQSTGAGRFWI